MAYFKTEHLERVDFATGDLAFCKPCDAQQPMKVSHGQIICPSGHRQHAANIVVNSSARKARR